MAMKVELKWKKGMDRRDEADDGDDGDDGDGQCAQVLGNGQVRLSRIKAKSFIFTQEISPLSLRKAKMWAQWCSRAEIDQILFWDIF